MIGYVFLSSLRAFLQLKKLILWLLLIAALLIGVKILMSVQGQMQAEVNYVRLSELLVFKLLAFVSAIFSTAIIAGEVEQRTIVYLLTRPVPRWQLLMGRYLASVFTCFIVMTLLLIGISLLGMGKVNHPLFARDLLALAMGSLAYGGLYLAFSLLVNRSLTYSLLYAFGWESLVTSMPGQVYYLSIGNHLLGLAQHPKPQEEPAGIVQATQRLVGETNITPTTAAIVLTLVIAALAAFNIMWFARNEFVPREDAE